MSLDHDLSIAVVGMAGRFPGAADIDAYWKLLDEGREGISFFANDELEVLPTGLDPDDPHHVKAQGIIDGVEDFDAAFFNIPAREARWLDPQHRHFLETCWAALEDAGYDVSRFPAEIALYGGANLNSYLLTRLDRLGSDDAPDRMQIMLANDKDYLTTRVAYKLNLLGESIGVQTSCSTSLVSVHMACQSLLSGQSAMALAGGVSIRVPQKAGYVYQEGMIASPDGHCRPFDAAAQGTVPGSGVGVVVLKLLADAQRDGDNVYAVIRGSAINNDGNAKAGFTAPSVNGQADVIAKALAMADVEPDSIGFVEAHGTGTPIGDPIEVEALTRVYRQATERTGYCALGAVKSNIGHLDAAAGVAGLIKAVLALHHRRIPPTLHFQTPNPALNLDKSPFFVNRTAQPWSADEGRPRRCAVSSFGIGGTNAHLVLEEAPVRATQPGANRPRVFPLSANTPTALQAAVTRLNEHLEAHSDVDLADVAHTLCVGRKAFGRRAAVVASSSEQLRERLQQWRPDAPRAAHGARVVFACAGQGAKPLAGVGHELSRHNETFAESMDRCATVLRDKHSYDLSAAFGDAGGDVNRAQRPGETLPALFSLEYSLAQMWLSLGISPDSLIGHSFGEYAAACISGIFSLEDGLRVAVERGRLMERLPPGAMLAVRASEHEIAQQLAPGVVVAIVNSDTSCVVSGPVEAIEAVSDRLRAQQFETHRLPVPFAFHSAAVDEIAEACGALMESIELREPVIPLISNLTGKTLTDQQAVDPHYWVRQMRQPVLFANGLQSLRADRPCTFIEMGPAQSIAPLLRRPRNEAPDEIVLGSLAPARGEATDSTVFLNSLARLWSNGADVQWERLFANDRCRRVSLPAYPFERRRYWVEMDATAVVAAATPTDADSQRADTQPAAQPRLPEHAVERSTVTTEYAAPENPVESAVIEIWEDVLGLSGVGRDDRFFELGGDSLLATQVFNRLSVLYPDGVDLQEMLFIESPAAVAVAINAQLAGEQAGGGRQARAIEPVSRDEPLPLSFAQEWLWSVDQSMPGKAAYNFPFAARVRGDLDVSALHATLMAIVARHEVLRSAYPVTDGVAVQRIDSSVEVELPVDDLTHLATDPALEAAREKIEALAREPFDLANGPLFRSRLLRLGPTDHVIVLCFHHIVADAWSMGIFARDLSLIYPTCVGKDAPSLPPLRIQYADYAAWQRSQLDQSAIAGQLDYWRDQLAGAPQELELATDRPRPPVSSGRGARVEFRFGGELADRLRRIGQQNNASLFMVLLSGFSALLHRQSGQEQMLLGVPVAGRNHADTEELIGCFINTVVIRTDHRDNPRFGSLLEQVRETTTNAFAHQETPFERVVSQCQARRRPGLNPLVQVLFNFQNIPPQPPLHIDGLEIEPLATELGTAKLDLIVDMWEREDGLAGSVEFNTDIFDHATIEKLMASFEALLTDAADAPDKRLAALELVSEAQRSAAQQDRDARASLAGRRFRSVRPTKVAVMGEEV